MSLTVEFCGEQFALSPSIGLMPLLKFAKISKGGAGSEDMDGLVAIYDMLEQCIAPEAWERFCQVATDRRVEAEELMAIVPKAIEVISNRPTSLPSDSPGGLSTTFTSGEGGFSDADRLRQAEALEPGRPDMAMGVLRMLSA